jgi:pimeloyl-ACP methyl ester carboxylesterase
MTESIVIYVHGVWMPAEEMLFVRNHLQKKYSLQGRLFDYPSVKGTLDNNAKLLADYISDIDAENVHLVGHSLGGVIALRMLSLYPDAPHGRVVCMGSPLTGSRAAHFLHSTDWGGMIIGKTVTEGVVHAAANEWANEVTETREVGSLAGNVSMGLGRLVANFKEENDGTIAVSETRLKGATDHICMALNHSGMVLSKDACDQVAHFLQNGRFSR